MITGYQIKAARALLGLSVDEFERLTGVSSATIRRIEKFAGTPNSKAQTIGAIEEACVAEGVEFIVDHRRGVLVRDLK